MFNYCKYLLFIVLLFTITNNTLVAQANTTDGTKLRITELKKQINSNLKSGKSDSALINYFLVDKLATPNYPEEVVSVNLLVSSFLEGKGAISQALKLRLKELLYYSKMRNANELYVDHFFCFGGIAGLFTKLNQPDSAFYYYKQSFIYATAKKDSFLIAHSHNNLAVWYRQQNQLNNALKQYKFALGYLENKKQERDSIMYGIINGNIADVLLEQKKYEQSLSYYQINLTNSRGKLSLESDFIKTALSYATAQLHLNNFNAAYGALTEAEQIAKQFQNQLPDCYLLWVQLYLKQGNVTMANTFIEKYRNTKILVEGKVAKEQQSTIDFMGQQQVNLLETEINNQRKNAERSRQLTYTRYQLLGALIGILVLGGIVLVMMQKRKTAELLKMSELEKIQHQLVEQQLLNEELVRKQLDNELKSSKKDITTLSIDILQQEGMRVDVIKRLKQINRTNPPDETKQQLTELITELTQKQLIDQAKTAFKENVEQVNNAFFEKLADTFPALSKSEREFCALIRLNLSTKEISTMKNITPESTKVLKHRIRKKLGLDSGDDIYAFMAKM